MKNKMLLAVAAIIIIVAVVEIVIFFTQNQGQLSPTPTVVTIVDGNLTVEATSYKYFNFTVEGTMTSDVQGTFAVSGNSENIRVYIMDRANFTDWQNAHNARMYYDSGEVNNATIAVKVPAGGDYYLVYDNTGSSTSKNVTTNVSYDWL